MRDWCRQRLAGFKCPTSASFIADADMPRTATGKIQHRVLKALWPAFSWSRREDQSGEVTKMADIGSSAQLS